MTLPRLQWAELGDPTQVVTIEDSRIDAAANHAPIGSIAALRIRGDNVAKEQVGYLTRDEAHALHAWLGALLRRGK